MGNARWKRLDHSKGAWTVLWSENSLLQVALAWSVLNGYFPDGPTSWTGQGLACGSQSTLEPLQK